MECQIAQFWKSSTLNSAASNSARLNITTVKAATLNSGASLMNKQFIWQLIIVAVLVMCCLTTAQQSAL